MTARTINVCDSRDVTLHLHSRVSTDTVEDADADVEDADDVVEGGDADVEDADFQKRRSVMAFNPVPVRRF